MPTATIKPGSVDYEVLDTSAVMGDVLDRALSMGYRGKVEAYTDQTGKVLRHLELNHDASGGQVSAWSGDVLIWDTMEVMSQDVFHSKHTAT